MFEKKICEFRNVHKSFDSLHVLKGVDLCINEGEIHALIGENGAGKSTAMNILYGQIHADQGEIFIRNQCIKNSSTHWNPRIAFQHGIGMVHQHFMLEPNETVLDNLVLGIEKTRLFGIRNRRKEETDLHQLMQSSGLNVPLKKKISELTLGEQSRCEILKVLYRKANLIILDEPTAVLTPQEIKEFLNVLRGLKKSGNTILLITHKLSEIIDVADRVTVLRSGKSIVTKKTSETSVSQLSEAMIGRPIHLPKVKTFSSDRSSAASSLIIEDASLDLKLNLYPGQITGIAGVEGNGQEKIFSWIEKNLSWMRNFPENHRIALIPQDRNKEGIIGEMMLYENIRLGRRANAHRLFSRFNSATENENDLLTRFDIRPNNNLTFAKNLSGGNQQKLIAARELGDLSSIERSVIFAIHPTRGVDLGAIELLHKEILSLAEKGASVLLISSELEELMSLCHQIGVFYRGKIEQWFHGPNYDEKKIGQVMLTGKILNAI